MPRKASNSGRWPASSTTNPVLVVRTSGAPYAAAWIDGTLRVNPAFVVMAAAPLN
jgi:hypothetical protein